MRIKSQEIINFIGADCSTNKIFSITGFNSLELATSNELTFFVGQSFTEQLEQTAAEVILVHKNLETKNSPKIFLFVDNPKLAFFELQKKFSLQKHYSGRIHPQALVDAGAKIGKNVTIYPFAYVDKGAKIGDNSVIYPHSYLGEFAEIGKNCVIYSHCAILERVIIGNEVIIHAGCVLGSDGFGFITEQNMHHKVPQLGTVEIADQVEIGANCAIDRGTMANTKIGKGSKLDNLVHIGHNVQIGENCLLAGQVGIAGSTKLGNNVYCGGQVGILGHNQIGDASVFHPRSCFLQEKKILAPHSHMAGVPAIPIQEWRKNIVVQKKLSLLEKRVRELEKKLPSKNS